MIFRTFILRQKPNAGWNMLNRHAFKSNRGSGQAIIYVSLAIILLVLLIFVNAADYALYSHKRSNISKGIDYAVCAAIQEIDLSESESGLAYGYNEATGQVLSSDITLNEVRSDNAFFSTFEANTGISGESVKDSVLIAMVNPTEAGINYIIKKGMHRVEGSAASPEDLESIINARINVYWDQFDSFSDRHIIFVNGNLKTNNFKKTPYYIVFVKDYQIDGLFRKRTATFVGFAGAKIERRRM